MNKVRNSAVIFCSPTIPSRYHHIFHIIPVWMGFIWIVICDNHDTVTMTGRDHVQYYKVEITLQFTYIQKREVIWDDFSGVRTNFPNTVTGLLQCLQFIISHTNGRAAMQGAGQYIGSNLEFQVLPGFIFKGPLTCGREEQRIKPTTQWTLPNPLTPEPQPFMHVWMRIIAHRKKNNNATVVIKCTFCNVSLF